MNLASGPSLLQGHRLHWLRYPTHLVEIHLLPTNTGHPPWLVSRSTKPLVRRLIQKAASPALTGILGRTQSNTAEREKETTVRIYQKEGLLTR